MLGHDGRVDEADNAGYRERQEDEFIEVAEDGNEIRDEVNRRQGIRRDHNGQRLREPRHARVAGRQTEGYGVPPDNRRPVFEPLNPSSHPSNVSCAQVRSDRSDGG